MTPLARRLRSAVLVMLVVAGVLALVSAGRGWAKVGSMEFTGREVTGGLVPALGWLPLVLVALLPLMRAMGRRLVAVLSVLVGVAFLLTGLLRRRPPSSLLGGHELASTPMAGPWWLLVAGLLCLVTGPVLWWLVPRWPVRAARFERGFDPSGEQSNTDLWKAMDAGFDPTEDVAAADGEGRSDQR